MPKAKRGEVWLADLGLAAKVRPVLVLSVAYEEDERAVVSFVTRTTTVRATKYAVPHRAWGEADGAFDAQGIGTVPDVKLERRLGVVDAATLGRVEQAVRAWLAL